MRTLRIGKALFGATSRGRSGAATIRACEANGIFAHE